MKQLFVIAGPNGAGKTTFATKFLPEYAEVDDFVNADLIARGLSPFAPEKEAISAGKLFLKRIENLVEEEKSFGLETTLSGKSYQSFFRRIKAKGYRIQLFFLWLPKPDLALQRVADRVKQGGHFIPDKDVKRRYFRGIKNFWTVYRPLLDNWIIFDNSEAHMKKVAFGTAETMKVEDQALLEVFLRGIR